MTIAGAGMAGLVAAARLRELGFAPRVLEKGDRPGGSMLLSSGVVWRHRTLAGFREECPGGDPVLQELLYERLDGALDWLERLAVPALERDSANPRTLGRRFDTGALTDALARRAGEVRLSAPLRELPDGPVLLATGGFGAALARSLGLPLRASPGSEGDGLELARARGAAVVGPPEEFYGRALPAPPAVVGETDFVRASQLYGRFAQVVDEAGEPVLAGEPSWSETDLVQAIARGGGRAWYVVDSAAMRIRERARTVGEMVDVAEQLGGDVRRGGTLDRLGLAGLDAGRLREPPFAAVRVVASVTHTIHGLRVDRNARVLREDGSAIDGLYAAGVDAGGVATGGYASGLATALVLGLAAAEAIACEL